MNKWLVGLVVLVAGLAVGWYVMQGGKAKPAVVEEVTTQEMPATPGAGVEETVVSSPGDAMERSTVAYTDGGFAPNTLTVKKGTNVTFTNQSSKGMWVASALHPTHQLLPGFDQLKSVANGGTYEYTFEKVGTWKYHNHVAASDTGTVVVTE